MRILFDNDVVLDLLLDREPFSETAATLFTKVEMGEVTGYICATTVTTIHYLATKVAEKKRAKKAIRKLLSFFEIAPVNRAVLEGALEGKFKDFEDGVVSEAAHQVEANAIITRNIKDFKTSIVPAYSPMEMVKMLKAGE